ncbi:hypothetical protein GCM10010168_69680 [Actinoplanes ianthinogenes]|uniref:Uncharacterized protein n=1 Tax=Actinoplanes ianthinogenes TaxID=122358 RepID=A0ABM7M0Q7_9ACTN|nr:hypothetical protein Aiant_58240 [Actinoplanes ianthinogenes]GGR41021.1 hypothetical protein GCM10010168_69680 [Actinoplanes ianthinogenes]
MGRSTWTRQTRPSGAVPARRDATEHSRDTQLAKKVKIIGHNQGTSQPEKQHKRRQSIESLGAAHDALRPRFRRSPHPHDWFEIYYNV